MRNAAGMIISQVLLLKVWFELWAIKVNWYIWRMKNILAIAFLLVHSVSVNAQSESEDQSSCSSKCNRSHVLTTNLGRVSYYQYPTMDKYDMKYLKLDLAAEPGSRAISGTALWNVVAKVAMDSFVMEFKNNMILDSVYINGTKRIFQRGSDHVFIPLTPAIAGGSTINAVFYYTGTANSNGVFSGTVGSNGLIYTATLSESYQAREWFPVKQLLTDKIDSADIWITTRDIYKAGSNGLLVAEVPKPGNKKQYQWKTRYPMNYYLPHFSIGNYMEYNIYAKPLAMAPDSILVQNYIVDNASYFTTNKPNIDKTTAFIELYSDQFGLYPFKNEKYGHVHASIGGGMEHQTMSTMNSFGSTLIAHELGHQWWGDNVTCASWNHIWLNEGFASYSEYLAIESLPALFTTSAANYMQNVHNNVMSSATGSVYVPEDQVYNEGRIFSGRLSYNKGSAIIHTLRFIMQNDNLFFQALRNFQNQYKDSVATATDFKQVAETTSGKNLDDYFNQWYYGEGYPTFNITYLKQGSDSLILIVNQTTSAPAITPFFKGLYEIRVNSPQGDTTVLIDLQNNNQVFKFGYTKTPNGIVVDPNNWVLNATGSIVNGGVVPVKILSVTGTTNTDCGYTIEWRADNQMNAVTYEVEYSADGVNFTKVGEVPGNGFNQPTTYNFTFNPTSGSQAYFRIKIMERYYSDTYSQVVLLSNNCGKSFEVTINQNPFGQILGLEVSLPAGGITTFRMLNSAGQLVLLEKKTLLTGTQIVQIPVAQKLSSGVYTLQVVNEQGETISKRVVKR